MTPAEVERVFVEVRRACHGFAEWTNREIELLAAQNGSGIPAERLALREQWDRVLATANFRAVAIVVRMLEAGRLPWPPFGQLLAFLRSESKHVASELSRAERQQTRTSDDESASATPLNLRERIAGELERAGRVEMAQQLRRQIQSKAS